MMANDLELRHTAIAGAGSAAFLKVEAMKLRLIEFVTFLTLLLSVGSSLGQRRSGRMRAGQAARRLSILETIQN